MVRVLIIDDNDRQSERLMQTFAEWGWNARRASGAPDEALAALREGPFDLALMDLAAAERGDYAVLRARTAEGLPPIVITTRTGVALARLAHCVEHGASDYITHPQNQSLLRARLDNVLQRRLLQQQARTALESFNEIEKIADDLRLIILPLGAALSAETDFDRLVARIVAEAQAICTADMGILYLVGDDGQLHYSYVNVRSLDYSFRDQPSGSDGDAMTGVFTPIPLQDEAGGAPNHHSLPAYVALTGESVNLADLHAGRFDLSRIKNFEAAQSYHAQSCLTVPLRSGQIVGALLLINCLNPLAPPAQPQIVPFDVYHQLVAESLASQAAVVLNNRLLSERQAQLLRFKRELEIGREIQLNFLPARLPPLPGWELVSRFRPALEVAGDFFDVFLLPHGHVALVISDVVGKGVTAALFMAIIRTLFRALFQQNYFHAETTHAEAAGGASWLGATTPFSFVDRAALLNAVRLTNAYLIGNHSETYAFATMWAAVLDPSTGRLLYVNAGQNPPLILGRAHGQGVVPRNLRERLQPTGPALGLMANAGYWLAETHLVAGDLLFAYTDGATEARNPAAEELGLERVIELLEAAPTAEAALLAVEAAVREHTGSAEAFDDVTMLALGRIDDSSSVSL